MAKQTPSRVLRPRGSTSDAINHELLRAFVAAADAPTFAEAARARHVTKAAVSQQMKTLEAQLGIALFERVGRYARVTESGTALLTAIRPELIAIDDALSAAQARVHDVRGEVRIGAPQPFSRVWLRPRLARLLAQNPRLTASVVFGTPTELEKRLVDRALDFAVLVRPPELLGVVATPVHTEHFALYASPKYVKAHGVPHTPLEFGAHRYIVFDADLPMHAQWWRAMFGAARPFRGEIVCRVASLDEMRALAESGTGLVVLPDYFAREAVERHALIEIEPDLRGQKRGQEMAPSARAANVISLAHRVNCVQDARFLATRSELLR